MWSKLPATWVQHPPPGLRLTGWRDPFFLEKGEGPSGEFVVAIASGIEGSGGCVLVYRSPELLQGAFRSSSSTK